MRKNDYLLTQEQFAKVRTHAKRALDAAGAKGTFPTPVDAVLDAAKVIVAPENVLDDGFLSQFRKKAGGALKQALGKVLGFLDARESLIFVDRTLAAAKQAFIKLHETGHFLLPWQRKLYAVIEECDSSIAPEVSELFEREANAFASEVLFQIDSFTVEAEEYEFGIKVPLKLQKKYGASAYASIRRYVSHSSRTCAVVVLNPPVLVDGDGFTAEIRRVVCSPRFQYQFQGFSWPPMVTPDDQFGEMVPVGRKRMSGVRSISLTDSNGIAHECVAEAFSTPYQTFILICVAKPMTSLISV